jgi:acyl-CoA synthetase (AMP-forming)/AMP-acid ligase II
VDRHAQADPSRVALLYEGNELSESKQILYDELLVLVSKLANVLKIFGVRKGSVVSIHFPVDEIHQLQMFLKDEQGKIAPGLDSENNFIDDTEAF